VRTQLGSLGPSVRRGRFLNRIRKCLPDYALTQQQPKLKINSSVARGAEHAYMRARRHNGNETA